RYFYQVTTAGTTGSTAPTHTTGSATSGTAVLTVVGRTATATCIRGVVTQINAFSDISEVLVLNGGSGYVQGSTTVTFSGGSPTSPAIGNVVVEGGKVSKIIITYPGYGYQSTPTATISGVGTGAVLLAVTQYGYGY